MTENWTFPVSRLCLQAAFNRTFATFSDVWPAGPGVEVVVVVATVVVVTVVVLAVDAVVVVVVVVAGEGWT